MGTIEKTVFISYRRDDVPWALAVYQHLSAYGYDVFFDYNSIHSGDFEQIIVGNIRARAHFVLILTPSALERCHEPGDWLRREIEAALGEKRNIIPLFFDGFTFGDPAVSRMLTGELAALTKYNGFNIHTDYFDAGMQRLRDQFLNVELEAVLHPLSQEAQKEVRAQKEAADRALQADAPVPAVPEKKAAHPPAQAAPPSPTQRNPLLRLALVGLLAVVGVCGVTLSYLGVRAVLAPSPATLIPGITASSPGLTPTAILTAQPESPEVAYGPWKGQTGRLEISVERVEVTSRVGDQKILRFYLSANNQTGDSITLPLFSNFLAIDSSGQSYTADHQLSNWPRTFPAGERVTGSIDLKDPVPEGVSSLKINFSTIFGALEMVGKSITVTDISVP